MSVTERGGVPRFITLKSAHAALIRVEGLLDTAQGELIIEKQAHQATKLDAADHAGEVESLLWTVRGELIAEKTAHRATTGETEAARRDAATLRAQVMHKWRSKGQRPHAHGDRVLAWRNGAWVSVLYTGNDDWDLWHSVPDDPKLDPVEELQLENARLKQQVAALLGGGQ